MTLVRHIIFILIVCLILPSTTLARDLEVEVNIECDFEPAQTLMLYIDRTGVTQGKSSKVHRVNPTTLIVSGKINDSNINSDTLMTAIAVSESGDIVFGNLRAVTTNENRFSFLSLPTCPKDMVVPSAVVNQTALVKSLVDIRLARLDVLKKRYESLLDSEFSDKLDRVENGFGLSRTFSISPNITPIELIDRLSRILTAVNTYRSNSSKSVSTQKDE